MSSPTSPETPTTSTLPQIPKSKLERKQEAKQLKRQRILDAGGKRPRKKRAYEEKGNDKDERNQQLQQQHQQQPPHHGIKKKKKKKKNASNNNSNSHGNSTSNRFGKVMINTPCPKKPRFSTLSIAIPGSIVSNAQTMELRTYLIGQIARACTIYHVDEIIVFDDNLSQELKVRSFHYHHRNNDNRRNNSNHQNQQQESKYKHGHDSIVVDKDDDNDDGDDDGDKTKKISKPSPSTDPHTFMANILQYCECPQYLRRHFFPMHPDLQFAGLLNPLDAPHHVRVLDKSLFREGVVLDKKSTTGTGTGTGGGGSLVDCGIRGKFVE
jgi:predicted SPOUT superfamily RNA methylase MTH1